MKKIKIKSKYTVLALLLAGGLTIPVLAENTILKENVSAKMESVLKKGGEIILNNDHYEIKSGEDVPVWGDLIEKATDSTGAGINKDTITIDDRLVDSNHDDKIDNLSHGVYSVKFSVQDSFSSEKITKKLDVTVINEAPEITLNKEKMIYSEADLGTSYSFIDNVTKVFDDVDSFDPSKLEGYIEIDKSSVDIDGDGKVSEGDESGTVTYKVVDGAGQVSTKELNINLDVKSPIIDIVPEIEVEKGAFVDWKSNEILKNVSDETSSLNKDDIQVNVEEVDSDNDGVIDAAVSVIPYSVTYKVSDSINETTKVLKVTVKEAGPVTPTVNMSIDKSVEDTTGGFLGLVTDGKVSPGETLKYKVEVQNNSTIVAPEVIISDIVDSDDIDLTTIADISVDGETDPAVGGFEVNGNKITLHSVEANETKIITYSLNASEIFTDASDVENKVQIMAIDSTPPTVNVSDIASIQKKEEEKPIIKLKKESVQLEEGETVTLGYWRNNIDAITDNKDEISIKEVFIDDSAIDVNDNDIVEATPGTYEVTYTVIDSDGNEGKAVLEVEVLGDNKINPDLSIEKTVEDTTGTRRILFGTRGNNKVEVGETLNYTIKIKNISKENLPIENIVVEDAIDEDDTTGIQNISVSADYTVDPATKQLTINEIPVQKTVTIKYETQASSEFLDDSDITNIASVISSNGIPINETNQPTSTVSISKETSVVTDTEAPVIELNTSSITVFKGDRKTESDWKDYIKEVGDNVSDVQIEDVQVDNSAVQTPGSEIIDAFAGTGYEVKYSLADDVGNIGEATLDVEVKDRNPNAPMFTFTTNKVEVEQGQTVSLHEWKSYIDKIEDLEDGLLGITGVNIDAHKVDQSEDGIIDALPGIYQVEYSKTDSDGNVGTDYLEVEVLENELAPKIKLTTNAITVAEGDSISSHEWRSYIEEVIDPNGVLGIMDVEIDVQEVDEDRDEIIDATPRSEPYTVKYKLEDSLKLATEEKLFVTVKEKEEVSGEPEIKLTNDSVTIDEGTNASSHFWKTFINTIEDDKDTLTIADVNIDAQEVDKDKDGTLDVEPGVYNVYYTVVDNDGNEDQSILKATVLETTINNEAPKISLFNNQLYLVKDSTVPTAKTFLENIKSIEDNKDTLAVSDVTVDTSRLNMEVEGNYPVLYTIKDSDNNIGTANLTVYVTASGIPEINLTTNAITVKEKEEIAWEKYINKVSDLEDGEISKTEVIIDGTTVDSDGDNKVDAGKALASPYNVSYTVKDSDNIIGVSYLQVQVTDENGGGNENDTLAPVIKLYDNSITTTIGSVAPKYEDNIKSITDNKDKLTVDDIEIDSSKVNMDKVAEYIVTYSAQDKSGNIGKSTLVVNVVDKTTPVESNEDPYINLKFDSIILYKGQSEPNWLKYVSSVGDEEDNLGVENLTITENVDTSKLGDYKVYYSLTDSDNNTTVKTLNVKVDNSSNNTLTNTSQTAPISIVMVLLSLAVTFFDFSKNLNKN